MRFSEQSGSDSIPLTSTQTAYVLGHVLCVGEEGGGVSATVIYSAALTNVTCEMKSVLDTLQEHCLYI